MVYSSSCILTACVSALPDWRRCPESGSAREKFFRKSTTRQARFVRSSSMHDREPAIRRGAERFETFYDPEFVRASYSRRLRTRWGVHRSRLFVLRGFGSSDREHWG